MTWKSLSRLSDERFRRLTGVERATFTKMLAILRQAHRKKKARGGRKNALSVRGMLLMALEYLREYRTYLHIGAAYGVSESTAYENIRWVEDTLIKDGTFSLPGKKELLKDDTNIEAVLVDVTESPVQRPKKNSADGTRARRSGTRRNPRSS
jgi:hypothetical protein